jgi:hypothetical protein
MAAVFPHRLLMLPHLQQHPKRRSKDWPFTNPSLQPIHKENPAKELNFMSIEKLRKPVHSENQSKEP